MLFDPARHEPLRVAPWDEHRARRLIEHIAHDTEATFSAQTHWPLHPQDAEPGETAPKCDLYYGACGVVWALRYLQSVGAIELARDYAQYVDDLLPLNRASLGSSGSADAASYMMGDTGILLLSHWLRPSDTTLARLEDLIRSNLDHPARELMWGSPGTLLAALFLHERTGEARWADLYRTTARKLRSQLIWSPEHECHYWTQEMYGQTSTYIDGVHGFVATAVPLIHGRHLMAAGEWDEWERVIVTTVMRTATREGPLANWRPFLLAPAGWSRWFMQYCHGAPGFVVCLGDMPGTALDELLIAAGEAVWAAGPLTKGSNLCHGTGGNGYAFLKLFRRTRDGMWLHRARAFAMHGIAQTEADAIRYGRMRHSLWTGDPGFAIYLWDCIREGAAFPTLDVFFAG